MARRYTAWVIGQGRGEERIYLVGPELQDDDTTIWRWNVKPARAMQFGRRSDARRLADFLTMGVPVEKQFG